MSRCDSTLLAQDLPTTKALCLSHPLGSLVAGAAERSVIGQDVDSSDKIVTQTAASNNAVAHCAHEADLGVADKDHCPRFQPEAGNSHVRGDQVECIDVEAQVLRGKASGHQREPHYST